MLDILPIAGVRPGCRGRGHLDLLLAALGALAHEHVYSGADHLVTVGRRGRHASHGLARVLRRQNREQLPHGLGALG